MTIQNMMNSLTTPVMKPANNLDDEPGDNPSDDLSDEPVMT